MKNIINEIFYDVKFIQSHRLQPTWYKALKIFILLGVICGYVFLFGWRKAILFAVVFLWLSLAVHIVYRIQTRKFTRNWLDCIVVEEKGKHQKPGIGRYYYSFIVMNAVIAWMASQLI
jgi:hypothetical protein